MLCFNLLHCHFLLLSSLHPTRAMRNISAIIAVYLLIAGVSWAAAAPAGMYVLGDSLVDAGNNNHLPLSLLRADFPHNGIDFPTRRATGRFSNGKNFPDFLAEKLGLPSPPPYLSLPSSSSNATLQAYLAGVNFASGGAGIFDSTNSGQCISLSSQIDYLSAVYGSLVQHLGPAPAADHLAASLFTIVIGANDIMHYINSGPADPVRQPAPQFTSSLSLALQANLQKLYNLGARNFALLGAGPIGCCPSLREKSPAKECDAEANALSAQFNAAAAAVLQGMAARTPGMRYSFFDTSAALLDYIRQPSAHGFVDAKSACCGLGDLRAKIACLPVSNVCANRSGYIFWDLFHPTEAAAGIVAAAAFDAAPPLASPISIRELSGL